MPGCPKIVLKPDQELGIEDAMYEAKKRVWQHISQFQEGMKKPFSECKDRFEL